MSFFSFLCYGIPEQISYDYVRTEKNVWPYTNFHVWQVTTVCSL